MVLVEDLDINTLPNEMQSYLRTYTYIDARNYEQDLDKIRKKIRYSMPGTPLEKIREMQRAAAEQRNNEDTGIEVIDEQDDEEPPGEEIDEFNTVDETNQKTTTYSSRNSSDNASLLSDFIEIHEVRDETSETDDEDDDNSVSPRLEVNEGSMEMIEMQDILHTETQELEVKDDAY